MFVVFLAQVTRCAVAYVSWSMIYGERSVTDRSDDLTLRHDQRKCRPLLLKASKRLHPISFPVSFLEVYYVCMWPFCSFFNSFFDSPSHFTA